MNSAVFLVISDEKDLNRPLLYRRVTLMTTPCLNMIPVPADSQIQVQSVDVAVVRLLQEINSLAATDLSREPEEKVAAHLQALAAEVRLLLPKCEPHSDSYKSLVRSFHTLGNIKEDRGISVFINGLGRQAQGNWQRIAVTCRRQVESYNRTPSAPKPKLLKSTIVAEVTESYPILVRCSKAQPVMLIGGIRIPEKLNYIRKMGVECEWYETDKTNPRATHHLIERIKHGKTPAVIFFESFMAHSTFTALKAACNFARIPFATAERAGQGAMEAAFQSLEQRLS